MHELGFRHQYRRFVSALRRFCLCSSDHRHRPLCQEVWSFDPDFFITDSGCRPGPDRGDLQGTAFPDRFAGFLVSDLIYRLSFRSPGLMSADPLPEGSWFVPCFTSDELWIGLRGILWLADSASGDECQGDLRLCLGVCGDTDCRIEVVDS